MEFHISRAIRQRADLDDVLFSYTGNVVFGNLALCRALAQKLTELRQQEGRVGVGVQASVGLRSM